MTSDSLPLPADPRRQPDEIPAGLPLSSLTLLAVAGYLAVSAAWLFFSHRFLPGASTHFQEVSSRELVEDGTFALITAAVLAAVLQLGGRSIERSRRLLAESEARTRQTSRTLRAILEASPIAIVSVDTTGCLTSWNSAAASLLGWDEASVIGRLPPFLPDDARERFRAMLAQVERGGSFTGYETQFLRRDGTPLEVRLSTAATHDESGSITGAIGLIENITESRRHEELHDLFHDFDSRILKGEPLESILSFLCRRLAELHDLPLVQISLKGEQGRLDIRAHAGRASDFARGARIRWDETPEGRGPTGRAIRTGEPAWADVENDPDFTPWRESAARHGLRSGYALPLLAKGETLGALTVYRSQLRMPDESTEASLRGFADQIALSLLTARNQDQIRIQTVALDSAANAVVITDRGGRIRWVNPAFSRLSGWSAEEVLGKTPAILRSGMHPPAFYKQLWDSVLGGQVWRSEIYNRRKDGTIYIEDQTITPVRGSDGIISHFIAIKEDVSERKRQEERIQHLAVHDALTDLPNRRALEDYLRRTIDRAKRGAPGALLLIDLDHFKLVNDTHGHLAGDELLINVAKLLQGLVRPSDIVARLGGDEFAVLLDQTSEEAAIRTAERVRTAVHNARLRSDGSVSELTISIGLAPIDGGLDDQALFALADSALYAAKERGRNRIVVFRRGREGGVRLAEEGLWVSRIRDSLRTGSFELHFQPVVRLLDGNVGHYEALIRMRGETGELIFPDRFLRTAERFGLMPKIDQWVVDETLRILEQRSDLHVFVNLSGLSLCEPSLLDHIEGRVRESKIRAGQLAFEVTETVAISDIGSLQHWIRRLKDLGCAFALDDFGIGFSSFSYLRSLPADYVKIDASFVRNIDTDPTNRALVKAIKAVAGALGKQVIAEAVENRAVESILRDLDIEHGQGWFLGVPSPDLEVVTRE